VDDQHDKPQNIHYDMPGGRSLTTVAVVDDEPDIVNSLKTGLELHGFKVDTYTDPERLIAEYKPGRYEMMLLDIRMPKLNGFELYREIKKKDDKAKICFLTAFDVYQDEFQKMFPTVHVNCFIRKPIRIAELVIHIKRYLSDGSK
jgi:DNA-binding response OmpR family regulator